MKRILVMLLVPASLFCGGVPKIEFVALTHDFGKQPRDARVSHRFVFTNTGTGNLLIEKIEAG